MVTPLSILVMEQFSPGSQHCERFVLCGCCLYGSSTLALGG
jgi:hypothetical protein